MIVNIIKIFAPAILSFFVGVLLTPPLSYYLYKYQMWKKKAGKIAPDGRATPIFNELHKDKEVGIPRMGGVIIWSSVLLTIFIIWLTAVLFPGDITRKINFLSRNQTWLPLFTLIAASVVGLIDDWWEVSGRSRYISGGLSFNKRLAVVTIIGLIGAAWFYYKLELSTIFVPGLGDLDIGWFIIPVFVAVMIALFSSSVIDGIDGLAGGVMAIIFAAYSGIAFFQNQIDLAAFCAVITGGTLAFLWFNIPPARFYMSETGILGLTTTLTVVAFLTNSVLALPIIAFPLLATSLSVSIQLLSKKLRHGRKIFLVAPVHHHFEALGWPAHKVVMRYWVISIISAVIGMIVVLIGR
ncbi:MAG: hypothetical protein AAB468_01655 [Patescibacteria group bacterium]